MTTLAEKAATRWRDSLAAEAADGAPGPSSWRPMRGWPYGAGAPGPDALRDLARRLETGIRDAGASCERAKATMTRLKNTPEARVAAAAAAATERRRAEREERQRAARAEERARKAEEDAIDAEKNARRRAREEAARKANEEARAEARRRNETRERLEKISRENAAAAAAAAAEASRAAQSAKAAREARERGEGAKANGESSASGGATLSKSAAKRARQKAAKELADAERARADAMMGEAPSFSFSFSLSLSLSRPFPLRTLDLIRRPPSGTTVSTETLARQRAAHDAAASSAAASLTPLYSPPPDDDAASAVSDASLGTLIEMGFDAASSREALARNGGNVSAAIDALMDGGVAVEPPPPPPPAAPEPPPRRGGPRKGAPRENAAPPRKPPKGQGPVARRSTAPDVADLLREMDSFAPPTPAPPTRHRDLQVYRVEQPAIATMPTGSARRREHFPTPEECRHWARRGGRCPVGARCHFLHGDDDPRWKWKGVDHEGYVEAHGITNPCAHFFGRAGKCNDGEKCAYSHGLNPTRGCPVIVGAAGAAGAARAEASGPGRSPGRSRAAAPPAAAERRRSAAERERDALLAAMGVPLSDGSVDAFSDATNHTPPSSGGGYGHGRGRGYAAHDAPSSFSTDSCYDHESVGAVGDDAPETECIVCLDAPRASGASSSHWSPYDPVGVVNADP